MSRRKKAPRTTPAPTASRELPSSPAPAPARFRFPWRVESLLVAAGLVALDLVVFAQLRTHAFISIDDSLYITKNPDIQHGLTWPAIVWAFTTGHAANWHPLTWMSHMLDVQMFGLWAGGHHLTSVALHVLNTLLLFFGLQWMTGPASPRPGSTLVRSAVVAAFFGIHPLHVESVAWAAERKDVLSTLFWWLSIGAYVAYTRRPDTKRYAAVAVLFALGLMSKPMLVTVPFVLLLLDVWPLERVASLGWGRLVREKAPLLALSAVSTIVTLVVQQRGGAVIRLGHLPISNRIANAVLSYGRYLANAVWPAHLAAFYSYPLQIPLGWTFVSLVTLVAISVGVWRLRTRAPYLLVGWLWYLGSLLPVIGLIQVGSQAMADRYTYVPMVGIFVAVVWGLADAAGRWSLRPMAGAVAAAAILACTVVAHAQAATWLDSVSVWKHAIAVTRDNFVAYGALASLRADEGRGDEALELFSEAVRSNPTYPPARTDYGFELMAMGKVNEAAVQYRQAIRLDPDDASAHQSFGVVLAVQGRTAQAIEEYQKALRLAPSLASAHVSLGVALAGQGKFQGAVQELAEGVRLDPSVANAHYRLGAAYQALSRADEAVAAYREAIRLKPDFPEAHNDLGFLLYATQKTDEAIAELTEAIRLKPAYPEALENRGMAYGAERKMPEALSDFTAAVRLEPDFEAAHYWRGMVLAGTGRWDDAHKEFSEVLRLNPRNQAAQRALAEVTSHGGRLLGPT